METKNIKESVIFPGKPSVVYKAWMDSKKHGEMVEGSAKIDPRVGGRFSIWNRQITGKTLKLDPRKNRITQEWRYEYEDWPKDKPSIITLEFLPHKENECRLEFSQTGILEKYRGEIAQGWNEYYWEPMKKYFAS